MDQTPDGPTLHVVEISLNGTEWAHGAVLHGHTRMGDTLLAGLPSGTVARYIRVSTDESPSWVAWRRLRPLLDTKVRTDAPTASTIAGALQRPRQACLGYRISCGCVPSALTGLCVGCVLFQKSLQGWNGTPAGSPTDGISAPASSADSHPPPAKRLSGKTTTVEEAEALREAASEALKAVASRQDEMAEREELTQKLKVRVPSR